MNKVFLLIFFFIACLFSAYKEGADFFSCVYGFCILQLYKTFAATGFVRPRSFLVVFALKDTTVQSASRENMSYSNPVTFMYFRIIIAG